MIMESWITSYTNRKIRFSIGISYSVYPSVQWKWLTWSSEGKTFTVEGIKQVNMDTRTF